MTLEKNILLIERENGEFDKVEFLFRYVNLNKEQLQFIQNLTGNLNVIARELKDSSFVVSVPLTSSINPQMFRQINDELKIDEMNFGLWISFTSDYDHSGFRLPQFVKEFYREVGGQLDCSIINN